MVDRLPAAGSPTASPDGPLTAWVDAEPLAAGQADADQLRALEHRQHVLTEMVRVQRALARRSPLEEKLDLVTAAVAKVLDIPMVALRVVDTANPDELVIASGIGLAPQSPRRSPVEA